MTTLDPALCADGCGTPATEKRPYADNRGTELVCDKHGGDRMTNCRWVSSTEPRIIPRRHLDPCECDGERGCLPCLERERCNG